MMPTLRVNRLAATLLLVLVLNFTAATTRKDEPQDLAPVSSSHKVVNGAYMARHLPPGFLPQSFDERNLQQVQITRFALINADSNTEITTINLETDKIISLNALPSKNLSIEAIVTGSFSNVVFDFDGVPSSRTEKAAPYALCGHSGSPPDYSTCKSLGQGKHTITANAIVGTSTAASKTVSFEIVNVPVPVAPVPVVPVSAPVAPVPVVPVPDPVAPTPVVPRNTTDVLVTFMQASQYNTYPIMDPASLAALYARKSAFGIWYWFEYRPHKAHKGIYSGLKGGLIVYRWSQLEPAQGVYDWTQANDYMAAAIAEGLYFDFALMVGPDSPAWLYQQGVPEVKTTNTGFARFPYYFDPLYLESFDLVKQEAIAHMKTLPTEWANSLVTVTLNDGSTGDPGPYKGVLLPGYEQFAISDSVWDEFRRDNIQSVHDYLGPEGRATIEMAFTHMTDETRAFVKNLYPNVKWFKNGMASHGYHIPEDEASVINVQRSQAFDGDATLGGTRIRWFGEMDREWKNGWFQRSTKESFWWSAIYALHMGLSRWHIGGDAMAMPEHHFAFDFFNKHGEYIDAATSPSAFCALRDGLDASDTVRFSTAQYGTTANKTARLLNILNDYAPYGAVVEDLNVTGANPMKFRQRRGYVDVLYGGVRGNYHRFLYQIDPSGESRGWWHVGNNSWPYGLFARSFEASTGRNAMYFVLDDRFINDTSTAHNVIVSVTYYDQGDGTWELLFKDPSMGVRSAASFTCSNTPTWKKVQLDFFALLNRGLDKGADLILRRVNGSDTKFHMIELDRGVPVE